MISSISNLNGLFFIERSSSVLAGKVKIVVRIGFVNFKVKRPVYVILIEST